MADEQKQDEQKPAEKSQEEAVKQTAAPETVTFAPPVETEGYIARNETLKDLLKAYGETDVESLTRRVSTDPIFAQRFVDDVLKEKAGEESNPEYVAAVVSNAPQERNITGRLDHSKGVPEVVKGLASHIPPPNPAAK